MLNSIMLMLMQMRGVLGETLRGQLLRRLAETEAHWRDHQARVPPAPTRWDPSVALTAGTLAQC